MGTSLRGTPELVLLGQTTQGRDAYGRNRACRGPSQERVLEEMQVWVAGEGIEGGKLGRHGELSGRAGPVDGRMAKGGAGPLDGVRAVGRRRSPVPRSHGEETRLGFPIMGHHQWF